MRERTLQRYYIYSVLFAGVPGVILGAHIILFIPDRHAEIALGLMTMALGFYSLFKPGLGQDYQPKHQSKSGPGG